MKRGMLLVLGAVVVAAGCTEQPSRPSDPLNGAWRLAEMDWISGAGDTVSFATRESFVLFADGYYSIGYAFGSRSLTGYAERWHPTDEEKVARFGSIIVNSGSYRTLGSRIEAKPLFALAPEFVGGRAEFSFTLEGDTLALTWEKSIAFDGLEYPSGGAVTLLRLVRVD
jgi:hypothetical protein